MQAIRNLSNHQTRTEIRPFSSCFGHHRSIHSNDSMSSEDPWLSLALCPAFHSSTQCQFEQKDSQWLSTHGCVKVGFYLCLHCDNNWTSIKKSLVGKRFGVGNGVGNWINWGCERHFQKCDCFAFALNHKGFQKCFQHMTVKAAANLFTLFFT